MWRTCRLQSLDQLRVHVFVAIRYPEDDDFLLAEITPESTVERRAVSSLHHENEIGPLDLLHGKSHLRIGSESGGIHFDPRMIGKDLVRSGAAQSVP